MKKKKDERVSNVSNNVNKQNKDYAKVNGGVFVFTKSITVGELAKQLNVGAGDIIKKLFLKGKMVNINQYLDKFCSKIYRKANIKVYLPLANHLIFF